MTHPPYLSILTAGQPWVGTAPAGIRRSVLGLQALLFLAIFSAGVWMTGCGTPAAPQPPSLRIPELVKDLTAVRTGNTVTLRWTMPRKTTDHLLLSREMRGAVPVRICLRNQPAAECETVGWGTFAPEAEATFKAEMSSAQQSGAARQLLYFVETRSRSGKAAGLSNAAVAVGGAVPPPITGLVAQVRADGVALHWDPEPVSATVRLHRTQLTPSPTKAGSRAVRENGSNKTPFSPGSSKSEPLERDFRVDTRAVSNDAKDGEQLKPTGASGALDPTAKFGEIYQYTAQRFEEVSDIKVDGKLFEDTPLELDGAVSAPVRVEVIDTFPPAVPQGLAAVAVEDEQSIDLSWQPDTEEDLAGYVVYRADAEAQNWKRISGAKPVTSPAYRDSTVVPGQSYRYAVSATDITGHESKRSTEALESFPKP